MKTRKTVTRKTVTLTLSTVQRMRAFLLEIESLIDADDGTVFQIQHIEDVAELHERLDNGDYNEV